MTSITRFNPFNELARMDPFADEFFKGFALRPVYGSNETAPQMRLDVTEDDKAYTVKAEIPGVSKDDIKVSVDGNMVSISAEVKKEKEEKEGEKVIRSERYYGSVSRSFTVSQDVDENAAAAKYSGGVLELTLPKKPGGSLRQVKVT
ncbi:Hsp20/alpha crystallin family protein [Hydrogenophaga sp.]|uniref:Hsp20/alpha crystallin family protein n=1 Tax=Hydrogenophaga sp. TaxID=1904254 RepID=UPI003F6D7F77